jgi:hypothetical protein
MLYARNRQALLTMIITLMNLYVQRVAASDDAPLPETRPAITWQCGAFVDVASLHDFNDPANHLFRSRGTTFHVNDLNLNMTAVYIRKVATEGSRWGVEGTFQTGDDSLVFGFSATAPNLDGSWGLRHLGPTDISYLAPVGKGLTLQRLSLLTVTGILHTRITCLARAGNWHTRSAII